MTRAKRATPKARLQAVKGVEKAGGSEAVPEASAKAAPMPPDSEVRERPIRRRFTVDFKRRILKEAAACTLPGDVGALLGRHGLYYSNLTSWQ